MKPQLMLKYFISINFAMLMFFSAGAQNDSIVQDSTKYKQKYGLRLGGDLSKILRTVIDDDYTGFEINADYRYSKNLYIAGELGIEEKTTSTEFLNSTAKGSYFKAGVDYNMYKNWLNMENMIYSGFRVGISSFSQTVNSYTIFNTNQDFSQTTVTESNEFNGLSAIWAELIFGIKAEVLNNLYIGLNVQLKGRITETEPDNFENIYIPGFGRTYDSGSFGIGFGYNVSYLIPLYKKGN
ncbi:MAG: hypothetical protein KAJ28_06465, partial [Flavobacteriaceae bacterium]|nr:hypothetical protein [Flavobacteriaceae bacterium]